MKLPAFVTIGAAIIVLGTPSIAQSAFDWSGAYGGLALAAYDGTQDYGADGDAEYNLEGTTWGAFGGYNWVRGNMVYGAELAYSSGGVHEMSLDGGTSYEGSYEFQAFIDLKGRVGYTTGNYLIYGTLGYTYADFLYASTNYTNAEGFILGAGVDYAVSDRYFIGGELTQRLMDVDFVLIESSALSLTIRGGMTF